MRPAWAGLATLLLAATAGSDVSPRFSRGLTYISYPNRRLVIAVDPKGREVWRRADLGDYPCAIWPTAGGGCVVGIRGAMVALDRQGKTKRTVPAPGGATLTTLKPAPGGGFAAGDTFNHTATCLMTADGAAEVRLPAEGRYMDVCVTRDGGLASVGYDKALTFWDSTGRLLNKVPIKGSGTSIHALRNGSFLITCYDVGSVLEVSRDGAVQWELPGLQHPLHAQRLRNGNTLVANFSGGKVIEATREGKIVWTYAGGGDGARVAVREE